MNILDTVEAIDAELEKLRVALPAAKSPREKAEVRKKLDTLLDRRFELTKGSK